MNLLFALQHNFTNGWAADCCRKILLSSCCFYIWIHSTLIPSSTNVTLQFEIPPYYCIIFEQVFKMDTTTVTTQFTGMSQNLL